MTERITLEISDATMQRARQIAQQSHRPIETVLAEWIEQASSIDNISPLNAITTYRIDTQFGAEATARSLLDMLHVDDNRNSMLT